MIRRPTSVAKMLAWHRAYLAGERPATHEDEIQCGWFRCRMVRGGPWVPAKIWLHREIDPVTQELTADEEFRALLGDEFSSPLYVWGRANGHPISREQYNALHEARASDPKMLATHVPYQATQAIRPQADLSLKAMRP